MAWTTYIINKCSQFLFDILNQMFGAFQQSGAIHDYLVYLDPHRKLIEVVVQPTAASSFYYYPIRL